jgi:hypothetical protein
MLRPRWIGVKAAEQAAEQAPVDGRTRLRLVAVNESERLHAREIGVE